MNNDKYIIMYCNNAIGTFNNFESAMEQLKIYRNNEFYLQKNEFSIHIKIDL